MDVLKTIRLTNTQKKVLCKIVAAETPIVASDQITGDQNMIAARDILVDLGLITYNEDDGVELTETGKQVMIDHALIDENHQLTEEGSKYAYSERNMQQESISYKEKFVFIKNLLNF